RRVALLEDALALVGDDGTATRAQLLAYLAEELDPRDWQRRHELADEAVAAARAASDPETLVRVVNRTMRDLTAVPERLAERVRLSDEMLALDPVASGERWEARYIRMMLEVERGDAAAAAALFSELQALAHDSGLAVARVQTFMVHSWRALLAGDATT